MTRGKSMFNLHRTAFVDSGATSRDSGIGEGRVLRRGDFFRMGRNETKVPNPS